jgi:hypothetical protein
MSAVLAFVISFLNGILFLLTWLFLLTDIEMVPPEERRSKKLNHFLVVLLSILFFLASAFLLITNAEQFKNPLPYLINDVIKSKYFLAVFCLYIGLILLYYQDSIFDEWHKKGIKKPKNPSKYKIHVIIVGLILLLIGFVFMFLV